MAYRGGCLLWRLGRFGPTLQQPEGGGMSMDWTTILALLVTIGLVGYLTIALLVPERFS